MDWNRLIFKYIYYSALKLRGEWFIDRLKMLEKTQFDPIEKIKANQLGQLNKILSNASKDSAHYRGKVPERLTSIEDLKKLPFLEKEDLRDDFIKITRKNGMRQRLKVSGGSTGAPVTILKDNNGMSKELAGAWRGYTWAGIDIGDRQARFWGVPKNRKEKFRAKAIDFVCNRRRVSAFGYSDEVFKKSIRDLIKFKPDYLYGYVSILSGFSRYIIDNKLKGCIQVKAIICTSEVLTDVERNIIQEAFDAKVYNEYGCGEVGTIAHECEWGSLHINSENLIVEIIDQNGEPVVEGEQGEVVLTDLTNQSTPLIRYKIKDYARISREPCKCGRNLPVLEKIYGREYDSFKNNNGKYFHGEFFLYIVEDARKIGINISEIQFLQYPSLDVEVRVSMKPEKFDSFSNYVKKRIFEDFDQNIKININRVDTVGREESGKLRVVKRLTS